MAKKRVGVYPAKDLYISDWFLKVVEYVAESDWCILSAKYGLVSPNQRIGTYEKTLLTMKKEERCLWARDVLIALKKMLRRGDRVVFLAGARYREFLLPEVKQWGVTVEAPMANLPIGKQLAWLKSQSTKRKKKGLWV